MRNGEFLRLLKSHLLLALIITGAALHAAGQAVGQTVLYNATEQFENSPHQTTSLGNGVFVFS